MRDWLISYQGDMGDAMVSIPVSGEVVPPTPTTTAITVNMTWSSNFTDVDLHLVRPGGAPFDQSGDDCFYGNTSPDWNVVGDSADNPFLDVDDLDGYGPEEINLLTTDPGRYDVFVHYFNDRENE